MAKYSESELNKCSKKMLVDLLLSMQDQMELMNHNIELLTEQIRIANQKKFGRSSEKMEYDGQLTFGDVFNEAEFLKDQNESTDEPELEEIVPKSYKRKKRKGKRDEDLLMY